MPVNTKYKNYSVKDFLKDDLFLQWQLLSTETLDNYWKQVLQENPHQEANITNAIRTLHSMAINRSALSCQKEDEILKNIYARYHRHKIRRFIYWTTSVAAGLILLFFSVSPLTNITEENINVMLSDVQSVRLDTIQDVRLIIGNKKTITMAEDADISWSKKDEIEVNGRSSNSSYKSQIDADVEYSTLLVPYGKRSFLTLRDGTKIWINSGTELRFPANMEKKGRGIYVNGEIYIEVAKDETSPLYVRTSEFDVRVYGTKFNVTSYKADLNKSVVLVEGSVSVLTKEKEAEEIFLHPNQMYKTDQPGNKVTDVNALQYITWKDGIWQFTSERLENIVLRLSRYYGIKIHCDEISAAKSCTGKLVLFDDINETLQIIEEIFGVKYTPNQNEITISINP